MNAVPVPEFAKKPLEALRKISMEKNNPIRTNNLYISSQLHRWLHWMAELDKEAGDKSSPDAVAETLLRSLILRHHPDIEQLEADYWSARNKLDAETVKKLKETTNERERSASEAPG